MKGIIKYNKQKYRKSNKPNRNVCEGDIVKVECKRDSRYFKYNGIYVVGKWGEIRIEREGELTLCLKLNYNIFDFTILKLDTKKRKSLPSMPREDFGYNV